MNIKTISTLYNLEYEDPSSGFLLESFVITKNKKILDNFFDDPNVIQILGALSYHTMQDSYVVYCNGEYELLPFHSGTQSENQAVKEINTMIYGFLNHLWFIKDNSVTANVCFLRNLDQNTVFSNSRNTLISNASGEYQTVLFTRKELESLSFIRNKVLDIQRHPDNPEKPVASLGIQTSGINYMDYNNQTNRLFRALFFLDFARTNSFLPAKISYYMAILECLFTTDNIEVSKKIRNRTSFYVEGTKDDQTKTSQIVKKAYDIRSSFLHGNTFDNKYSSRQALTEISVGIDNIVRIILTRIIVNESHIFLQKDKSLRSYLENL